MLNKTKFKNVKLIMGLVFTVFASVSYASLDLVVDEINRAGEKYGIDPLLITAVIKVESAFNYAEDVVSHKGAQGLMQLMPITQKEVNVSKPYDIAQNVDGGTRYLAKMKDRFGSTEMALWAYNAGPTRVERGVMPAETRNYIINVLNYYHALKMGYAMSVIEGANND